MSTEVANKTDLYLQEVFAFVCHAHNSTEPVATLLVSWQNDREVRETARKNAKELTKLLNLSGIRLVKSNMAALSLALENMQTVPAKKAYGDSELS